LQFKFLSKLETDGDSGHHCSTERLVRMKKVFLSALAVIGFGAVIVPGALAAPTVDVDRQPALGGGRVVREIVRNAPEIIRETRGLIREVRESNRPERNAPEPRSTPRESKGGRI